jgi:hypothetical protein
MALDVLSDHDLLAAAVTFIFYPPGTDTDSIEGHHSGVSVVWRGLDMWAVTQEPHCLNSTGEWEYEPSPSNRDDAFLARCRFTRDEAIEKARELVNR